MDLSQLDETRAVLEAFPEKFGNPKAAKETLRELYQLSGIDSAVASTKKVTAETIERGEELLTEAAAISRSVGEEATKAGRAAKRGYEYLSKSETEDGFDSQFEGVCIDCMTREPCSMDSGKVIDKSDNTRFVVWPIAPASYVELNPIRKKTLLVVAKEVKSTSLAAEVQVEWIKDDCKNGNPVCGSIQTYNGEVEQQLKQNGDITVYHHDTSHIPTRYKAVSAMFSPMFTFTVAVAEYVIFGLGDVRNASNLRSFTPNLCCVDEGFSNITVIPYPALSMSGSLKLSIAMGFKTGGIQFKAGVSGELIGQFGEQTIESLSSIVAEDSSGRALDSQQRANGIIGQLADIASTLNGFLNANGTHGNEEVREFDQAKYSSGVDIFGSLEVKTKAMELKGKKNSPDLELSAGELLLGVTIGVKGTIDVIDAVANVVLSPAGATIVRETRDRIDNGDTVSGNIQADIILSATGSFEFGYESGFKQIIRADSDEVSTALDGPSFKYEGKSRVLGQAIISLHVEAKVWMVSAGVGAEGSLNTSWVWERRKGSDSNGKLQRRYYFEGLKAEARAYKELVIESDSGSKNDEADDGFDREAPTSGTEDVYKSDLQVQDLVDAAIKESQNFADAVCSDEYQCPSIGGDFFEILKPTKDPIGPEDLWENA
ncbi:hypothetical protein Q8W30_10870 [Neptunomonas phycophila]|uniref:Uncharacterized protein n=1 Tax=Neptunomonas phycophila TaxID=1572645 RepID=A0ABT9EVI6_9GAMM|nr:hypothetical protein [Neptunomonas phycophila]MDP2523071.1 hypothetical protein [Neptunomonas phycophila]